jgi:hypothetical protein
MLMGPCHFAEGKHGFETSTGQPMGTFFLDIFLHGISPLLIKQRLVRLSFGPHMLALLDITRPNTSRFRDDGKRRFGTNLETKTTDN